MKASFLTALALATLATALPIKTLQLVSRTTGETVTGNAATSVNDSDGNGSGTDSYTLYSGDGAYGFPNQGQWINFIDMFNANKAIMQQECGNNGWGADDSGEEIGEIYNAVEQIAGSTGVDHRFILAIILQESGGCVRVPTTNGGVSNPGIMQDHDGANSCNGVDPCPQDTVTGMVSDGTAGTAAGDGLANTINEAQSNYGVSGAQAFYYAARIYNSGSIPDPSDLGNGGGATDCYVSDVANRLMGWVLAPSTCSQGNADK